MLTVISCSHRKESYSAELAMFVMEYLKKENIQGQFVDLRDYQLPHCDGDSYHNNSEVARLKEKLSQSKHFLIASPIYCFQVNAACIDLIALTGRDVWKGATVGLMVSAGGASSYMAPIPFMNSLMLDYRAWVNPQYVYTVSGRDYDGKKPSEEIQKRLVDLVHTTLSR